MTLKKITLLLALLGGLTSCIKEPVEEDTPTTPSAVQDALSTAWGQADPLSMKKNDYLFQETEQRIDSDPRPFFVLQEGTTVSNVEETAEDYIFSFLYQTKIYKNDQEGAASTREDRRTVSKGHDAAVATAKSLQQKDLKPLADDYHLTLGFERLYGLAYACIKSDSLAKYCKEDLGLDSCDVACSNLKTMDVMLPAPDLMKTQPNCGGLANCTLRTKIVAFDWIISLKKGESVEKQRINYSVSLSPDLPFLSRMTEYCYRQLYTLPSGNAAGQKILVSTCTKLKNFKQASSLPSP